MQASNAPASASVPSSLASSMAETSAGRGRLPTWVVSTRSVLTRMPSSHPSSYAERAYMKDRRTIADGPARRDLARPVSPRPGLAPTLCRRHA